MGCLTTPFFIKSKHGFTLCPQHVKKYINFSNKFSTYNRYTHRESMIFFLFRSIHCSGIFSIDNGYKIFIIFKQTINYTHTSTQITFSNV